MARTGRPKAELILTAQEREQLQRWSRRAKSGQALSLKVAGIDLKGGMELGPAQPLFARLATTPDDAVDLLEDLAGTMSARAARLAGVERCIPRRWPIRPGSSWSMRWPC